MRRKSLSVQGRALRFERLEDISMLSSVSPIEVFVGSSTWNGDFTDHAPVMPVGSGDQLKPLPWTTLDKISIRFDTDVVVRQEYLSVRGVNVIDYTFKDFAYDPATFTATWTLTQSLAQDRVLLHLSDAVRDHAGNSMDGDWLNPSLPTDATADTFPAGDGIPGGDFMFVFNVLPGDVDQSGATNIFDTIKTRNKQFTTLGQPEYSAFQDVDGSGAVNIFDTIKVRNNQFQQLPSGQPTPSQRLLVELASTNLQEGKCFTVHVFRGVPDSQVSVELLHDDDTPVQEFGFHETTSDGKADITLQVATGLLEGNTNEDGFRVRISHGGKTQIIPVTILREIGIGLSSNRIQEGKSFTLQVARGTGASLIDVDILHDEDTPIYEYNFLETDANGNADISLTMPTNLIQNAANEDGFRIRVRHGGEERIFAITVMKITEVVVLENRIKEGQTFEVLVNRGVGNSLIDVDVYHDGSEPVHQYGFLETDADGNADVLLSMPFDLVQGAASEDGFRIMVAHGGKQYEFHVTIVKGQNISLSTTRIQERDYFNVRVERGVGNSLVDVDILHDNEQIVHQYSFRETDADGNADISLEMPMGLVQSGYEDGFVIRVAHGGRVEEFHVTIVKGPSIAISRNRIKLGESFDLLIERGKGESLVDVDIYHDASDPIYQYGFKETDGSGYFHQSLTIPSNLPFPNGGNEDGFRIRVRHWDLDIEFRVTMTKTGTSGGTEPSPHDNDPPPNPDPGDSLSYHAPIDTFPDRGGYIGFGYVVDGSYHRGADYASHVGATVYAVADGEVIYSGQFNGFGSLNPSTPGGAVVIRHTDTAGNIFYALYGHIGPSVGVGTRVLKGQKIGEVRPFYNDGVFLPHLHFGIFTGGAFPTSHWGYGSDLSGWWEPFSFLESHFG